MEKKETLRLLEECLKIEEEVIPLYSRHIESTLFLSGLAQEKQLKAKEILDKLKADSERHKVIFQTLIKKIKLTG
jgi:rubrerythrin